MIEKYKIIFLDFDGVLNSTSSFMHWNDKRKQGAQIHPYANPNPMCVTLLERLVSAGEDVRIVLSTSWRSLGTLDELKEILVNEFGMKKEIADRVIDKTPRNDSMLQRKRGFEILNWLEKNKELWKNYVILDDNSDMLVTQLDYFVHTNPDNGLTIDDYRKVRKILGLGKDKFFVF